MFGILDRMYVRGKNGVIHEEVGWKPQITTHDNSNISWYCFVPKVVVRDKRIREGLLPKSGKVTVYTTSYVNLLAFDVHQTLENLRISYSDSIPRIDDDIKEGRGLGFLGASIGNVLSMRCAGESSGGKINFLVSIVGGSNLGFSDWDSIATTHIAQNSGCDSVEEYEEKIQRIKGDMKKSGEWGKFFPLSSAYAGYNVSLAQMTFP